MQSPSGGGGEICEVQPEVTEGCGGGGKVASVGTCRLLYGQSTKVIDFHHAALVIRAAILNYLNPTLYESVVWTQTGWYPRS